MHITKQTIAGYKAVFEELKKEDISDFDELFELISREDVCVNLELLLGLSSAVGLAEEHYPAKRAKIVPAPHAPRQMVARAVSLPPIDLGGGRVDDGSRNG